MNRCLLLLVAFCVALPLFAVGPCPTLTGGATSPAYIAGGGGCNVVITFNADGSITTTLPNINPFDGVEDTLVGIVNNSASSISSINLSSNSLVLFNFDGDGACSGFYTVPGGC